MVNVGVTVSLVVWRWRGDSFTYVVPRVTTRYVIKSKFRRSACVFVCLFIYLSLLCMFDGSMYFIPTYSQHLILNGGYPTLFVVCRQEIAITIE